MGANFETLVVDSISYLVIQRTFELEQKRDLYENGHSYSGGFGMVSGLEFKDKVFETKVEAETWLNENAQKWEAALAVQFKVPNGKNKTLIGAWCSC